MNRHQASGRSGLGFALAFSTMALWAVLPLTLQVVLEQLDPVTITGVRFLGAALCLALFLGARGALPDLRALSRNGRRLLAIATAFLAINYLAFLVGLDWTSAAHAQVMIQLGPILLALGGIFVFGERFLPAQWAGMAILVVGLGVFFHGQWREPPSQAVSMLGGSFAMLLAATTWAFYGLAQKQLLQHLSSQSIMVCIYAACAVIFALGSSPRALLEIDALTWGFLLFTSANTLLGYGTFSAALEHWEASRVSAVLALTPLGTLASSVAASTLWPGVFQVEEIGTVALLGACAVVIGSLVVSLGDRRSGER